MKKNTVSAHSTETHAKDLRFWRHSIQNIAKTVPLDKILIETDSPYLAPTPLRGKVNEPKNCIHTAKFLAELKGLSFDDFANYTYNNSINSFNKIITRCN